MSKRAIFMVQVAGTNITGTISPVLIGIEVTDKVGTHSDQCRLMCDDTGGRIAMPQKGAPMMVALGWENGGVRPVFEGTVDEVRSSGSRGGGRTLTITGKGLDTTKKAKAGQQRHWDDTTIEKALQDAGSFAGVDNVVVDPELASIERKYIDMRDESFIHFGERLAREVGGNFAVRGTTAYLTAKGGFYTAFVNASYGDNLHSWDIAPILGRPRYNKARARWYDKKEHKWKEKEVDVDLDVDARYEHRWAKADEKETEQQAKSDKATSERDAGEGNVTIEGNADAIPDGLCVVQGTRPGIDGSYRIEEVQHNLARGGGWTTRLSLKQPDVGGG